MADKTPIEWTDATANVVNGCSVFSPGCASCYAMRLAGTRMRDHPTRAGLTQPSKAGPVWTGEVRFNEKALMHVLSWKRPRKIFWNAHGDLFHENVPDEWIDRCFAVMALTPHHIHQVLTKRSARMREYVNANRWQNILDEQYELQSSGRSAEPPVSEAWPLPNVWLGVSVEDQTRADERIPNLLATPAAVRWISAEPLLGPLDLSEVCNGHYFQNPLTGRRWHDAPEGVHSANDMRGATLDWVVVGGESGTNARPMHPDWVTSLYKQCEAAGVAFHFKQWGEFVAHEVGTQDADALNYPPGTVKFSRVGRRAAGRKLFGVTHDGFPS
jgi:protein gp37